MIAVDAQLIEEKKLFRKRSRRKYKEVEATLFHIHIALVSTVD